MTLTQFLTKIYEIEHNNDVLISAKTNYGTLSLLKNGVGIVLVKDHIQTTYTYKRDNNAHYIDDLKDLYVYNLIDLLSMKEYPINDNIIIDNFGKE